MTTPTQGTLGLRDPFILRRQDGTFVILATDLNGTDFSQRNQFIHVWFSTNLTSFTAAEYGAMVSRWGLPSWTRLKSYNFPDRYWRHGNFNARIDPYPFDPFQDQQWTMVAGLADSAGVSFRSVNFPDRYLRQSSFALRIDPNDGTAAFRGDATFYRVAGLADSGMSSFRSFSQPTRYIRHSNFALRLDVLTSGSPAVDRQDATFRVQS